MSNQDNISFVRTEMLEAKAPPASQVGAVKWIRENLFSSVTNTALTLLSIYVVFLVLSAVLPWGLGGVWDAGSLTECRTVLAAFGEGGHGGACWAVIEDRWLQLLFGFYPPEQYWRPILALVLLFVALAPILFSEWVPARLTIFSLVYPFLAVWLIWGGSFWAPLLILAGFAIAYIVFRLVSAVSFPGAAVAAAIVAASVWWLWGVPSVNTMINVAIGDARYETTLSEAEATLEVVGEEIAQAEAERDRLANEISAIAEGRNLVAAQAGLIHAHEITQTVPAQLERAVEAAEADEGRSAIMRWVLNWFREDPSSAVRRLSHRLEDAQSLLANVDGPIPDAQELPALQSQLLDIQDNLTDLRNGLSAANRATTVATARQSEARLMQTSLNALPEQIEELPVLLQARQAAYDAMPEAIRGVSRASDLPAGISGEDLRLFQDHQEAHDDVTNTSAAINATYGRLALTGLEPVESRNIGGFMLAVVIGASGIILSLPLGILLALGRQSDLFIINKCSVIFIEVIRGVPLIVWLFTAQLLLNYFLPPGTNFDLLLRVIIMVTLFSSAYIAEVIRGGLAALPRGQYEGADSLGLDYWQSMRLIILPQALKISIPGIVSSFIGLFKDTTLVVFIGLLDPIGLSNAIRASTEWNGVYWELFIFIGFCFFIFCFSMSRYSQWLERKLHTGHR